MINKKLKLLLVTAIIFNFQLSIINSLNAQTDVDLDPEFGARFALQVDKKLAKGLHVSVEEELRIDDNFGSLNRLQTTLGVSYKVLPFLKLGAGYTLINGYDASTSAFKSARHRLFFDATASHRFGDWQLSLRERLQMTHRTGDFNQYQNPANLWGLKSRVKVVYKGLRRCEPYASLELRHVLNAPVINAVYSTTADTWGYYDASGSFTQKGDAGWFLDGFNGSYLNRVRGALGFKYKFNKRNSIDLCLLADYCIDKEVDANSEGTKLKSYTRETGLKGWLTAGYTYQF